jgi:GTP cyclohydrolase II
VDERSFAPAAAMLHTLGIARVRLLTNNPDKLAALAANGIEIAGREPHAFAANGINDHYLATKLARLGHLPP